MTNYSARSDQTTAVAVSDNIPVQVYETLKSCHHRIQRISINSEAAKNDGLKYFDCIVVCESDRGPALKSALHLQLPNTPCISVELNRSSQPEMSCYNRLPSWITNDPMPAGSLSEPVRSVFNNLIRLSLPSNSDLSQAPLSLISDSDADRGFSPVHNPKVSINGKFFTIQGRPFYVKGVTYGTFSPNNNGDQYPEFAVVERDFARMIDTGVNTVRVYTPPPLWLLDLAKAMGLFVMVGIPWEQHLTILDDSELQQNIENRFTHTVKSFASHSAILCYSIGNEVPASIIRWHGKDKVSSFLKSLYDIVKKESPQSLVTYVNFPTTEYLNLDFVDFYSFNVYLESEQKLKSYIARLQHIAGSKPLLLAEVGLDSDRNGVAAQHENLRWQLRSIFDCGAAGAFVFSWTDEWYVGGRTIDDWSFGITTTDRQAKPAMAAVREVYHDTPFSSQFEWPSFTVVVCSYNGSATIRQTLDALVRLDYAKFEIIVVNDGSTDDTADIAAEYPVTLISTENKGLSSARNTGYRAGTGEIVAYIDDDAFPETHWLRYLALGYSQLDVVAIGGPNFPVPDDVLVADCVANAPGGPMEVMLTDTIAEHIPGCNMSFKRTALDKIGGFDPQFRAAGDDVDLCWRIIDQVGQIGFQPAAFNWHRRRNTVEGYWKQQRGYGIAEALLEKKWPEKYNVAGYISWGGRLYGQGFIKTIGVKQPRIYQGIWGSAPFQQNDQTSPSTFQTLTLMPEWVLLTAALLALSVVGFFWQPLTYMLIPALSALGIWVVQAIKTALAGNYNITRGLSPGYLLRIAVTSAITFAQPIARLSGRIRSGLTATRIPGKDKSRSVFSYPLNATDSVWDGTYQDRLQRIKYVNDTLAIDGFSTQSGNEYQNWDLQAYGGIFGSCQLSLVVEHHQEQTDHVRYRLTQRWSLLSWSLLAVGSVYTLLAAVGNAPFIAVVWLTSVLVLGFYALGDSGRAANALRNAVSQNAAVAQNQLAEEADLDQVNRREKHSVAA